MAQLNVAPVPSSLHSEADHILEMSDITNQQLKPDGCRAEVYPTIEPVTLAWNNLSVKVRRGKGADEMHLILDKLTGYAEPGCLLAVMGPSGSGKSTLLDALAGRLAKNTIRTGDVWLNGHNLAKASAGVVVGTLSEHSRMTRASLPMQLYVLTLRSFLNMRRDMGYYWLRVAVYLMVAICLGTIYLNVGTKYESISARASCMFFAAAFLTFMAVGGFPSFTEDMKVFHYERLNGHYGALTFILANTLSSIPFLVLITMVTSLAMYFMIGLHHGADRFFYFSASLFASLLVVECLMKAIASVIPNFLMGIILGAGVMGIFMLVSGFFRVSTHLPKPVWRYPMSYISFHTYTIQGMYENDFLGLEFRNQDPRLPHLSGETILRDIYGVELGRSKIVNLVILFCMSLVYILIFLVMIKARDSIHWRGLLRR